jgi:tellurite resistance protein TerC
MPLAASSGAIDSIGTPTLWGVTIAGVIALLVLDFLLTRKPHEVSMKEALGWSAFYIALPLLFGVYIWMGFGSDRGLEYLTGYLVEKSLSVDNLFVFMLLLSAFAVPRALQQRVLLYGIVGALILRGIFIALGAAAINNFSWVFYLFGAFLIYTAVKLAKEGESDDDEYEENRFMKYMERRFPATQDYHGTKLFVRVDARRLATPMFFVILALGTTDLLFALDSIPAIYGLTKEPYLVLTANLFALMGLRQLYFLIGGLLKRLVYLSLGLAVLLAFIGVKLLLHALHENELPFINGGEHVPVPEVPISVSLGAIVVILGVTTVASLLKTRRDNRLESSTR